MTTNDAIAINKGKDEVWCKQIDVVVGWRRIRVNFGCRNGVRVAFLSFGEVVVLRHIFSVLSFFYALLLPLFFCLRNSPNIF